MVHGEWRGEPREERREPCRGEKYTLTGAWTRAATEASSSAAAHRARQRRPQLATAGARRVPPRIRPARETLLRRPNPCSCISYAIANCMILRVDRAMPRRRASYVPGLGMGNDRATGGGCSEGSGVAMALELLAFFTTTPKSNESHTHPHHPVAARSATRIRSIARTQTSIPWSQNRSCEGFQQAMFIGTAPTSSGDISSFILPSGCDSDGLTILSVQAG